MLSPDMHNTLIYSRRILWRLNPKWVGVIVTVMFAGGMQMNHGIVALKLFFIRAIDVAPKFFFRSGPIG